MAEHAPHPPPVEAERLDALERYGVLDTPPEREFDDLVRLAAQVCAAPVALVTLVDGRRQFFKARLGSAAAEAPLTHGFCPLVVRSGASLVVPDTHAGPEHAANPAVTAGGVRFYAGVPLVAPPGGHALGTLCVVDTEPRPGGLGDEQAAALHALARQVMAQLELRLALRTPNRTA